jgi:hypothetical protein
MISGSLAGFSDHRITGVPGPRGFRGLGWSPGSPDRAVFAGWGGHRIARSPDLSVSRIIEL